MKNLQDGLNSLFEQGEERLRESENRLTDITQSQQTGRKRSRARRSVGQYHAYQPKNNVTLRRRGERKKKEERIFH